LCRTPARTTMPGRSFEDRAFLAVRCLPNREVLD
jgi:hypothetical protein